MQNADQESLRFSFCMRSMQSCLVAGSAKYLSISFLIQSGSAFSATIPVPVSPIVLFYPPTSVTIIGTSKWYDTELIPLCVALLYGSTVTSAAEK